MKLTVLGAGTFYSQLGRTGSSYLIEFDDQKIVFDMGRGTIRNLLDLEQDLFAIQHVFITHVHADHLLELIPWMIQIAKDIYDERQHEVYYVYGPAGFKKSIFSLYEAYANNTSKLEPVFEFVELTEEQLINKGWKLTTHKCDHIPDKLCLAYRLEANNKVFFYSGDSGYTNNLVVGAKDADLAIIEACIPNIDGHMNATEAGKIATLANVKKLLLTHVDKLYLTDVDNDVKKTYTGWYKIAQDKQEIHF